MSQIFLYLFFCCNYLNVSHISFHASTYNQVIIFMNLGRTSLIKNLLQFIFTSLFCLPSYKVYRNDDYDLSYRKDSKHYFGTLIFTMVWGEPKKNQTFFENLKNISIAMSRSNELYLCLKDLFLGDVLNIHIMEITVQKKNFHETFKIYKIIKKRSLASIWCSLQQL